MTAERLGWILAVIICMVLSQGYYGLALVGAGGLAALAWRVKETY